MSNAQLFSLTIKDKAALHASYMPFILGGGLFIPTRKSLRLRDELFLLLRLTADEQTVDTLAIAGKVVWLTPRNSHNGKTPGVGVQFLTTSTKALNRLESYLGSEWLTSDTRTHTL
jgi:type IV pilus assembly protein PilZ